MKLPLKGFSYILWILRSIIEDNLQYITPGCLTIQAVESPGLHTGQTGGYTNDDLSVS